MPNFGKGINTLFSRAARASSGRASSGQTPIRFFTNQRFVEPHPASIYDRKKFNTMDNVRAINDTIFKFTSGSSFPGGGAAEFDPDVINRVKYLAIQANRSGIKDEYKGSVNQTMQSLRQFLNHQGKKISNRDSLEKVVDELEKAVTKQEHGPDMAASHEQTMNPR